MVLLPLSLSTRNCGAPLPTAEDGERGSKTSQGERWRECEELSDWLWEAGEVSTLNGFLHQEATLTSRVAQHRGNRDKAVIRDTPYQPLSLNYQWFLCCESAVSPVPPVPWNWDTDHVCVSYFFFFLVRDTGFPGLAYPFSWGHCSLGLVIYEFGPSPLLRWLQLGVEHGRLSCETSEKSCLRRCPAVCARCLPYLFCRGSLDPRPCFPSSVWVTGRRVEQKGSQKYRGFKLDSFLQWKCPAFWVW